MTSYDRRIAEYLGGVEAIVFDWDDTIVDSKTGKMAQNRDLARKFGAIRSEAEVEALYRSGKPLPEMLVELCDHRASFDDIWTAAKKDYDKPEYAKRPIGGAEQGVRTLRSLGYRTALFTAVSPEALGMDMASTGFAPEVFDHQLLHVPEGLAKSDSQAFAPVMGWLAHRELSAREALYIGDGMGDMEGATAAGMKFIGVEQGFISRAEFAELDILSVPSVQKLAMIALNIASKPN